MSRNSRIGWSIFSLFVWLHLVPDLYPLPMQMSAEIRARASSAVESANSLAKQGVERDEYMRMSEEEWERGLTRSYWFMWTLNLVSLVIGLLSTYMLCRDHRAWPFVVGLIAAINLLMTVPPIFRMIGMFESTIRFVNFWGNTIEEHGLESFYIPFIWPIYSVLLLGLCIWMLMVRGTKGRLASL